MTNQYPKTIEAAALLLDEVKPNWYDKINIDDLSMHLGTHCILGQVYNGYGIGILEIFGKNFYRDRMNEELKDDLIFGRNASKKEWIKQIELRQEGKVPPVYAPQSNSNDKSAIEITIPKRTVANLVLSYIHETVGMRKVNLEDIEPIITQDRAFMSEFEGFKATVFVG